MIKNIIRRLRRQRVSWLKTLIINFKCLPFSQAKHLPIYIYSDTIISSYGHIVINAAEVAPGMIKIGRRNFFKGHKTYFVNAGTIEFDGRFMAEGGTCINNMGGYVKLGADARICEICKLLCMKRVEIGASTQIAFGAIIMDTDFHYLVDIKKKLVRTPEATIHIGAYCWFGNSCSIMKGTVMPDYSIVAGKSLCNKDYSQSPLYPVFAGSPAKCVADGKRRVYNVESRREIYQAFMQDETLRKVEVNQTDMDWDKYCLGGDDILYSED